MRHKQQRLLEQNIQRLEDYILEHKLNENQEDSSGNNPGDSYLITPESMILAITDADPDQANFKNSKWLIKNLLAKNFLWEDIEEGKASKAYDTLSRFLNIRKQWPEAQFRDINQYTGLSGIAEKIRPFEITKGMNELKREEKAKIYSETIVLYDKNDYLVVIPKTQEASCFWGRNTEWCTASTQSENYFDNYNKDAPLMICITPDNRKYQFHKDSSPMDENDKALYNITDPILSKLSIINNSFDEINRGVFSLLLNNYDLAKYTVSHNGGALQYLSEINKTKEICLLAIQNDSLALEFVPKELIDENFILEATKNNLAVFPYIPEYLKTKEICEKSVAYQANFLDLVPSELMTSELGLIALKTASIAINYIPNEFINYDIIKYIIDNYSHILSHHMVQRYLTDELAQYAIQRDPYVIEYFIKENISEEIADFVISQDGRLLKYIPEDLKTKELCEKAVRQHGIAIDYVPDHLRTEDLFEIAVQQNGYAITSIPEELQTDKICELAIRENGNALYYCFRDNLNPELYKIAVKTHGLALQSVPDRYRSKELLTLALQNNGMALQFISSEHENYKEFSEIALKQDFNVFRYLPESYKTVELCKQALLHDAFQLFKYIPKKLLNYELCEIAIKEDNHLFSFIPRELITDDLLISFIKENPQNIRQIPHNMITKKLCEIACDMNKGDISCLPESWALEMYPEKKTLPTEPDWTETIDYQSYCELLDNNDSIDNLLRKYSDNKMF